MKRRGFTLIELLVVMAIMGILTIITVSQFNTARIKARDSQRKSDLSALSKALLMYYADYNKFPDQIGNGMDSLTWGDGPFQDATGYVYMKILPKDSVNNATCPYVYLTNDDRNKYALLGCLENVEDQDAKLTPSQTCNGKDGYNFGFISPNISFSDISGCSL